MLHIVFKGLLQNQLSGPTVSGTSITLISYVCITTTFVLMMGNKSCHIVEVYYSPTNAQVIVLKTVLKFTLK